MVYIETTDDIAEEVADQLEIFGINHSFFVADMTNRMRKAVANEKLLSESK